MADAEFEKLLEASSLGAPHVKALREDFSVYRPPAPHDGVEERCPECTSADYGPVDIAWPFGRPEHNPNPNVSYVVGVCLTCGYTTDSNE
jgi:predicted nucleic-acid-binding Zn-ribbon protein